ncbi:MAG: T9SS type A sorting domain-containing protein [Crocinitomicaceae bacterium]|nr:T9SS type A sorting domain-containing protein [Crocinitomicaceae bacterium]
MKKSLLLGLCALGAVGTLNAQMTEDFEGVTAPNLPAGWSATSAGGSTSPGFQTGTSAASTTYFDLTSNSTKFVYVNDDDCNCDMSNEQLVSATFSLPAGQAYFLKFDYFVKAFYGETAILEISTNGGTSYSALKTLDPVSDWTQALVSLAAYQGMSNLVLRWTYNDNADWGSGLALDNIQTFIPPNDNAALDAISFVKAPGESVTVTVANLGGNDLTSFTIAYDLNGTAGTQPVTQTITPGNTADIVITGVTIPEAPGQDLTVSITNVNGGTDSDPSDNDGDVLNFNADTYTAAQTPNFTLSDDMGTTHDLYTLLGNGTFVVLDFMASWCGPCQSSTPELNTYWVNNGGGTQDVQVFAITVEETDDNAVMLSLNWGGNYPKIAHSKIHDQIYSYYNNLYGSGGIPFFIGICPNTGDPANSTVAYDAVGFTSGMFTSGLQPATDNCLNALSVDENNMVDNISVYPNPVSNQATVNFNVNGSEATTVKVVSTNGQVVKTIELGNVSGALHLDLDLSDLEAGIYILNIEVGGSVNTERISVVK